MKNLTFKSTATIVAKEGISMGAWPKYYIPGGFTSGNQAEAIIDSVPRGEYQVIKFNNSELMDWMRKGIGE